MIYPYVVALIMGVSYFKRVTIKSYITKLIIRMVINHVKSDSETAVKHLTEYAKDNSEYVLELGSKLIKENSELVGKFMSNYTDKDMKFKIHESKKWANIIFESYGKSYQMIVPYDNNLVRKMSGSTVCLIDKNDIETDITQKPGLPYLMTAGELGGMSLRMTKGETIKLFEENEHITF
jgi:hypothetical protein